MGKYDNYIDYLCVLIAIPIWLGFLFYVITIMLCYYSIFVIYYMINKALEFYLDIISKV